MILLSFGKKETAEEDAQIGREEDQNGQKERKNNHILKVHYFYALQA